MSYSTTLNKNLKLVSYLAVALLMIFALPYTAGVMKFDAENSWQLTMNAAIPHNLIYGRDLFFPYGPLNFLITPFNISNQLVVSILVYTVVYALYGYLLLTIVKEKATSYWNTALLLVACLLLSGFSFSFEVFMIQTQLLLIFKVLKHDSKVLALIYAVMTGLLLEIKYLEWFIALAMMIAYVPIAIYLKKSSRTILIMLSSLVATAVIYFIYNPSINDFVELIKSIFYISKGQVIDHALTIESPYEDLSLLALPFFLIALAVAGVGLFRRNNIFFGYYVIAASILYFCYRQGFVRHGGSFCFAGMAIFLSSLCICANVKQFTCSKVTKIALVVMALIPTGYTYLTQGYTVRWDQEKSSEIDVMHLQSAKAQAEELLNIAKENQNQIATTQIEWLLRNTTSTLNNLKGKRYLPETRLEKIIGLYSKYSKAFSDTGTEAGKLEAQLLDLIGNDTFTAYPNEYSYIVNHNNFVPLPAIHTNNSYNSWLDNKNYALLTGKKAPKYIIASPMTADNRNVYLEAPATATAIILNYQFVTKAKAKDAFGYYDTVYVFKKKEVASGRVASNYAFSSVKASPNQKIKIPKKAEFMNIEYELNLKGKLATLFWKIPEIELKVLNSRLEQDKFYAPYLSRAVALDNLGTTFSVTMLVQGTPDAILGNLKDRLFYKDIAGFELVGKGTAYLKSIKVNFYHGLDWSK